MNRVTPTLFVYTEVGYFGNGRAHSYHTCGQEVVLLTCTQVEAPLLTMIILRVQWVELSQPLWEGISGWLGLQFILPAPLSSLFLCSPSIPKHPLFMSLAYQDVYTACSVLSSSVFLTSLTAQYRNEKIAVKEFHPSKSEVFEREASIYSTCMLSNEHILRFIACDYQSHCKEIVYLFSNDLSLSLSLSLSFSRLHG